MQTRSELPAIPVSMQPVLLMDSLRISFWVREREFCRREIALLPVERCWQHVGNGTVKIVNRLCIYVACCFFCGICPSFIPSCFRAVIATAETTGRHGQDSVAVNIFRFGIGRIGGDFSSTKTPMETGNLFGESAP